MLRSLLTYSNYEGSTSKLVCTSLCFANTRISHDILCIQHGNSVSNFLPKLSFYVTEVCANCRALSFCLENPVVPVVNHLSKKMNTFRDILLFWILPK